MSNGTGDAVVTITVQVDDEGVVTGKTIDPRNATIRAASANGVSDGGKVTWRIRATRLVRGVTVKVEFSDETPFPGTPTSPPRQKIFQVQGNASPNTGTEVPSSRADVTEGSYGYTVTVQHGETVVGGEGTIEVAPRTGRGGAISIVSRALLALIGFVTGVIAAILLRRRRDEDSD